MTIDLTPKKLEQLELIYQGKDHKDIAEIMNVSYNVTKNRTHQILSQMRCHTTKELMARRILELNQKIVELEAYCYFLSCALNELRTHAAHED